MKKRILVVDDSATIRQIIGFTRDSGFDVDEAHDGISALRHMSEKKFHLVITDLNMPNLDGMSLVKEIRRDSNNRFLPIIMLTTEADEKKKREGKTIGSSGWIVKPFKPEQLLGVVRMLLK